MTKSEKIQAFLDRNGYKTNDYIHYVKSFPIMDFDPNIPITGTGHYEIHYMMMYQFQENRIGFKINYADNGTEWGDLLDEQFLNNPFFIEGHARNTNKERLRQIYDKYYE